MAECSAPSLLQRVRSYIKSITRDPRRSRVGCETPNSRPSDIEKLPLPTTEECDNAARNSGNANVGCRTPIDVGGRCTTRFTEQFNPDLAPQFASETLRKQQVVKSHAKANIFCRKSRHPKPTSE